MHYHIKLNGEQLIELYAWAVVSEEAADILLLGGCRHNGKPGMKVAQGDARYFIADDGEPTNLD